MTDPSWEVVQELFLAALEREGEGRSEWVRRVAPTQRVAAEVLSLLSAHEGTSPFDLLAAEQDAREEKVGTEERGTRFGAWEVMGELGRGGMGVVYHVRRADGQFEQEGALKILSGERVDAVTEARFFSERQILAELSHPNIAKLLDGGVSADGRPYFVMERVRGTQLDEHCNALRLDTRQRLRLFLTVCGAVQHAHRLLVVHRDLKPSNILVTSDGVPKLLDFGIAKLLMEEPASRTGGPTLDGSRLFTPGYASPEQMLGRPVTPASDVYQLGVLLYLVLTGRHPFRDLPGGPGASWTTAPESDSIVPPSRRLDETGSAVELSAARAATPDRLRRALAGDLDAVVLKALRPEPGHRYGSAGDLADDLRRHLDRRTVRARPDTVAYRTGRFLRRHPAGAVGAVGAFLAVVGFAVGAARQARATAMERDRAEEVVDFLVELFTSADPYRTRGEEITVREVLDQGAERARTQLSEQPLVQATLMATIGEVYRSLGLRDVALQLGNEALAARLRVAASDDPGLAHPMTWIALLAAETGDFAGADTLLPRALELLRASDRTGDEYASGLNDIGYAWQVRGDLDRAEPLLEESLRRREEDRAPLATLAPVLTNLGNIRQVRGDLDSAAVLFRRSVAARRTGAPEDPRLATSLESLADVLQRLGDLDAAEAAVTEALAIRRRVLPPGHVALSGPLHLKAMILRSRGRPAEAEPLLREALALRVSALGEEHFVVGYGENALALVLEDLGRLDEAEELMTQSWEVYAKRFGPDHINPVMVEANLARLLVKEGKMEEARARFEHALPIARRTRPDDRVYVADLITLGIAQCRAGDTARADSTLSEAVETLRPESSADTASDVYLRALNAHGSCLAGAGRREEAERVLRASLDASSGRADDDEYRAFALQLLRELADVPR